MRFGKKWGLLLKESVVLQYAGCFQVRVAPPPGSAQADGLYAYESHVCDLVLMDPQVETAGFLFSKRMRRNERR